MTRSDYRPSVTREENSENCGARPAMSSAPSSSLCPRPRVPVDWPERVGWWGNVGVPAARPGVLSVMPNPVRPAAVLQLLAVLLSPGSAGAGDMASREAAYGRLADVAALRAGLDPARVRAVIRVESAWRPDAVSPRGARGLCS